VGEGGDELEGMPLCVFVGVDVVELEGKPVTEADARGDSGADDVPLSVAVGVEVPAPVPVGVVLVVPLDVPVPLSLLVPLGVPLGVSLTVPLGVTAPLRELEPVLEAEAPDVKEGIGDKLVVLLPLTVDEGVIDAVPVPDPVGVEVGNPVGV
jgi:hypothetical protein